MKYGFEQLRFEPVARTGFFMSLISYVVFLFLDFVRPGFVSRAFSVHLFLAATLLFGAWWSSLYPTIPLRPLSPFRHFLVATLIFAVWWSRFNPQGRSKPFRQSLLAAIFAILAGVLTWNLTASLDDLRGLFFVIVFLGVINLFRLVKQV